MLCTVANFFLPSLFQFCPFFIHLPVTSLFQFCPLLLFLWKGRDELEFAPQFPNRPLRFVLSPAWNCHTFKAITVSSLSVLFSSLKDQWIHFYYSYSCLNSNSNIILPWLLLISSFVRITIFFTINGLLDSF